MRPLAPSRQIWGGHSCTRPPSFSRHRGNMVQLTCRRDASWVVRKLRVFNAIERDRRNETGGLWDDVRPLENVPDHVLEQENRRIQMRAEMKRWSGKRALFLGNYKKRRDAAFATQDNRGIPVEELRNDILDGLFAPRRKRAAFLCAQRLEYTRRQFGVGPKFAIDFDWSAIDLFIMAAKKELAGVALDLNQPLIRFKHRKPRSTHWPDARQTRTLSKRLHSKIKKVLEGDLVVIRATFQFLIDNYINRPYIPGLLHLLTHSLAVRKEWRLLKYLLQRAIRKEDPVMSNNDVAALVNYAISLSVKTNSGQNAMGELYGFAQHKRDVDWQNRVQQTRGRLLSESYGEVPMEMQLAKPDQYKTSSEVAAEEKRARADPYGGSIYTFLADAKIQLLASNGLLQQALDKAKWMTQSFLVPHYKSINAILREMIRVHCRPAKKSRANLAIATPSRRQSMAVRSYSTSIMLPGTSDSPMNLAQSWTRPIRSEWTPPHKASRIAAILPLLNHNNIHPSTIRLLANLTTSQSEMEIPWRIAQRAHHPKTLVRQTQKYLVEAACKSIPASRKFRHVRLSRGPLMIMRLEGMKIQPSHDAIFVALHASVIDGNISGARMILERLQRYGYRLEQNEVVELVKCLPSMGLGTMTTAAGEVLSSMYIRNEQLLFITELRGYITESQFLGPYVLALGRCGSAVEIWSVWNDVRGQKLKDGLVTTFVEGFVLAKDLQSAIDFVKMAYLEGYPLNLHRAQAIAGAVERGQRRIGVELVREMIRQKMSLHGTNKTKSILSILLSSQGIALGKDNSARSQFVARLSAELEEMIVSVKEAKDIEDALNEIDRILGVQDKEVV